MPEALSMRSGRVVKATLLKKLVDVNRELWLLLSLFGIAALINFLVASHTVMLNFYVLPTIFSAYFYGRRHAISTALASVLLFYMVRPHRRDALMRPDARRSSWDSCDPSDFSAGANSAEDRQDTARTLLDQQDLPGPM